MLAAAQSSGLDLRAALSGDDEQLRPTEIAQPALLLVECALRSTLPDDLDVVAVAGHSVGEYAAAVAAHALQPADAMRLVIERGRAMAAMREGTMCALIGIDVDAATAVCDEAQRDTGEIVVVANLNAPGQLVISGSTAGVDAAAKLALDARRAARDSAQRQRRVPLAVDDRGRDAIRHPRLMASSISDPHPPVVCNVDAQDVHCGGDLRDRLRAQLTSPVRWIDCVQRLVDLGAETLDRSRPRHRAQRARAAHRARRAHRSVSTPDAARALDVAAVAG